MSVQEMFAEIPKLSKEDLVLLQALIEEKLRLEEEPLTKRNSVSNLRGLIKLEKSLPNDWNWKQVKEELLLEKYS